MVKRWCLYLLALAGCIAFYIAHLQWLSWALMWTMVSLPLLSLLVSLPAMLCTRIECSCAEKISLDEKQQLCFFVRCPLPAPRCSGSVKVHHVLTAADTQLNLGQAMTVQHCGQLLCTPLQCWAYDCLGLFRIPVRSGGTVSVLAEPKMLHMSAPPEMGRFMANNWKPKAGGGFSENHELRLYRDGDSLKQIHWKLSAKTGKLIIREAMEPAGEQPMLTMQLRGTAAELDIKFGKLLYMTRYLLSSGFSFDICVLWQEGVAVRKVCAPKELTEAIDYFLCLPPAGEEQTADQLPREGWHFHIGGDGCEE